MYFTPPALARHIVFRARESVGSFERLRVMDPACGGAAFLLPVVISLRDALRERGSTAHQIVDAVNQQIIGIEQDRTLAELSRQFVRMALASEIEDSKLDVGPVVRVGNTLKLICSDSVEAVNVVLCNPPYRKISATELGWYRRHFEDVIAGQPNLYAVFMRAALRVVVPGGLIALLTPTSYFSGPSYKRIRQIYSRSTSVERVDLVHERDNLFLGVEHDVAALLARRRVSAPVEQLPIVAAWNERDAWTRVGSVRLSMDGTPWLIPRDKASSLALRISRSATWTLEDYGYRARAGPYVWNRDKREKSSSLPKGSDRKRAVPVIWATQIGQDGKFRFVSRSQKEQAAKYILLASESRRGVVERDSVVLQRTSSRAQHRRLVAAPLPRGFARKYGGFVAENHVIVLEPISSRSVVSLHFLGRVLNSEFMGDLYSTTSGTSAVTVSGLRTLALPDPTIVKSLMDRGMEFEEAIRCSFSVRHGKTLKAEHDEEAVATR
jgi:adenine-specific DNA-methyltransferase